MFCFLTRLLWSFYFIFVEEDGFKVFTVDILHDYLCILFQNYFNVK